MMKVFAYRKCSTCMKALKWLEAHNVEFEERAIKEENPTYEELKEWYDINSDIDGFNNDCYIVSVFDSFNIISCRFGT